MVKILEGINTKPLKRAWDERGVFTELMRKDLKDILGGDQLLQANLSLTYPGIIRAWHRHLRGQNDYFITLRGAQKICVYDEKSGELDEFISTGPNLQIIRIPGHYWHGFKAIGDESSWLIYFTTKLYNYNRPDEERRPWNDPNIKPISINGNPRDVRVGKPWDWNYPPHR